MFDYFLLLHEMETGKLRVKKKKRLRQYFITVLLQEQVKNSADRAKWISKDAANYLLYSAK